MQVFVVHSDIGTMVKGTSLLMNWLERVTFTRRALIFLPRLSPRIVSWCKGHWRRFVFDRVSMGVIFKHALGQCNFPSLQSHQSLSTTTLYLLARMSKQYTLHISTEWLETIKHQTMRAIPISLRMKVEHWSGDFARSNFCHQVGWNEWVPTKIKRVLGPVPCAA